MSGSPRHGESGDSLIGLTVDHGRYEIIKLIGEGGMGRVFQARQVSMNRMVALKLLRAQLASDENLLARFQQEALSVSRLRHPNTITVYDYGRTEDGYLFIAMELLGGRPLAQVLRDEGRLPLKRALHVMEQVTGAVAEAHSLGIVHRDLKPENIQLDQVANDPDFVKVLDFGIAKIIHGEESPDDQRKTLTMAGAVFGTPHYMSPEQVHGLKVDHRTDLYSLGIILHELLVGRPPFDGATPMAVMLAQASKPPPDIREAHPDIEITDTVAELIADCLVKDRDERIGSAAEMLEHIRQARYELGEISGGISGRVAIDPVIQSAAGRRPSRPGKTPPPASDATPAAAEGASADAAPPIDPLDKTVAPTGPEPAAEPPPEAPPEAAGSMELDALAPPGRRVLPLVVVAVLAVGGVAAWLLWPQPTPEATANAEPVRIEVRGEADPIRYRIESEPPGAQVLLAGEPLGTTPLERAWPVGERPELTLVLDGHEERTIQVPGEGEPRQTLTVRLPKKPPETAWLKLASKPAGAEVYLGDRLIGTTPLEWRPRANGEKVELRFAKQGYDEVTREVALVAGAEATPIEVSLPQARPRPTPPRPRPHLRPRPKPRPKPQPKPAPPRADHRQPTPPAPSTSPPEKKPDETSSPYQKL